MAFDDLRSDQEEQAQLDADEWLRSLPRKDRRKLLRMYGASKGATARGPKRRFKRH